MRRIVRIAAGVFFLATVVYWAVAGANRGFTINYLAQAVPDPVTGLEGTEYRKVFVPGWDFLAGSALGAGILAGSSFLFPKKKLEPSD